MAPHFTARPAADAAGGQLYVTDTAARRVDVLGPTGAVVRAVTWTGPTLEVTDDDLATYREEEGDIVDAVPASPTFPALAEIRAGLDGSLWVREYDRPGDGPEPRWLVFDPPARLQGRVRLPAGSDVLEVGAEHVVLLERDELDVERVTVYRRLLAWP